MNIKILNGNGIKLLAAVLMITDHIGMFFFPQALWLRCIGRISLPLFAYMTAEGCRYTKNKFNHLALLAAVALVCQIALFVATRTLYMCILVTFTLSVLIIYSLQYFKRCAFGGAGPLSVFLSAAGFIGMVFLTYLVTGISSINGIPFAVEYGFWGCMLPVFAAIPCRDGPGAGSSGKACAWFRLAFFLVGLVLLCAFHSSVYEWFALFAVIPLALYNGERGKRNLKYFFYVFYPAHLALFYLIALFV